MGQAQRKGQQSVRYKEVELELWELDADEGGEGYGDRSRISTYSRSTRRKTTSSRSYADSSSKRNGISYAGSNKRYSISHTGNSKRSGGSYINIDLRNTGNAQSDRQRPRRSNSGQTGKRNNERQLQIQDIRRYQGTGGRNQVNTRSAYRGSACPLQSVKRRRAKKRKAYIARTVAGLVIVTCLVMIYFMAGQIYRFMHDRSRQGVLSVVSDKIDIKDSHIAPPEIIEDLLEVNDFSRPATELKKVKNIFVHYTANPGTSAAQNRSYFANLALTQERSASAHLIIGYEGELIQCIPFDEQAYAVMTRNEDSISIECCYVSEDGSFTQETYDTLVHTLAWLTDKYHLSEKDILRHYDCGGKKCPIYYVEHEDAWNQLLEDVAAYENDDEQADVR